ncbi:hypothetical protein IAT38_005272 [Cryptococcus sp. DSM 104549]
MPTTQRYPPGVNPYAPSSSKASAPKGRTGAKAPAASVPLVTPSSRKNIVEDAVIEEFAPPKWRTVMHRRVDLGYPDFYPSRPGFDQPEDVLTDENVKNGFAGKQFVNQVAETFSMHGPIHSHLSTGGLNMLMQLGKDLVEKQQEALPQFSERTFRIPVRVTWNDTRRFNFLADLANPAIPLHRLMRTPVPHGFKGVELLDAMFSPASGAAARNTAGATKLSPDPIPLDRSLWFIRVLGVNEITAHRGRSQQIATPVAAPSPAAATPSSTTTVAAAPPTLPVPSNDWYSQEFTNTVISWLRLQLGQLALPSTGKAAAKPGAPAPKSGASVLGDEKARAKWLLKWDYSTRLLHELHTRHLLSSRLFAGWLADHLSHVNLAQLGFLAQLIGDYLPDMADHLSSAKHCLRAACDKLKDVRASPGAEVLGKVEAMLVSIIKTLYEANPDVLVNPTTWRAHSELLSTILPSSTKEWAEIRRRNEALWFRPTISEASSNPRRHQMEEIQKLDSMCQDTNMFDLTRSFFDGASSPTSHPLDMTKFEEKVFTLLNWSMGLFQLGAHRPYGVYTILKIWHDQHEEHQSRQARPHVVDLFDTLYLWLDTSSAAKNEDNVQAIGIVIGEFTRRGTFSYGRYLQTLIAKGHTARNQPPGQRSHHLALLRVLPIFVIAKDLVHQRRIALSGDDPEVRARDAAEEDAVLEAEREEVMEYAPEIFGLQSFGRSEELKDRVDYKPQSAGQMTRYLYVVARFRTFTAAVMRLAPSDTEPAINATTFVRVTQVFRLCHGYATIADFVIRALQESEDDDILEVVLDIVQRDADVWTAMDFWPRLGDKLLDKHHALQKRGVDNLRLITILRTMASRGRLTPDDEDEVKHLPIGIVKGPTIDSFPKVGFQDSVSALQHALAGSREDTALGFASKLYKRHGVFSTWAASWWALIVEVIQRAALDQTVRQPVFVDVLVGHMAAVLEQTSDKLDPTVNAMLGGLSPGALLDTFGKRSAGLLVNVLISLVSRRLLETMTILERVVFPLWKHISPIALCTRKRLASKHMTSIASAVDLVSQLLVSPPLDPSLPPRTIPHSLTVQASRQRVLQTPNVQNLIQHLPLLVVFQQSKLLPETTTGRIGEVLKCLAMTPEFKTAAFRNLNVLKDAFLAGEWSGAKVDQGLEAKMVDTLKMIMSEKTSQQSPPKQGLPSLDSSARFSAWRWTRIVLEMRVEFKGLAMRIANQQDVADARQTLNRLVHATLDRETTADDTDLLCETFRGMDAVVTQELLAAGLDRLANLLGQAIGAETQHQLETTIRSIEQLLRILDSTNHTPSQPTSDNAVLGGRHKLLDLIALALQSVERHMPVDVELPLHHEQVVAPPQPGYLMKTVMGLLRFALGVATADVLSLTMPKPNFAHLAVCFFKAAVACQNVLDESSAQTMADMLAYIIDATPPQARLVCQTALLGEATSPHIQSALSAFPPLISALPHLTSTQRNMSLLTPDTSLDHLPDSALPLDDRHWELFEYMAPPRRQVGPQDMYLASAPLKDQGSIPIALFSPTITQDAPPGAGSMDAYERAPPTKTGAPEDGEVTATPSPVEGPPRPWEESAAERYLGDGLAGEPTYARQMATMLFAVGDGGDSDLSLRGGGPDSSNTSTPVVPPARPKKARKSSSAGNGIGNGAPPKPTGSSHKDAIAVDEEDDDDDDSDVEEVEQRPSKKAKTGEKAAAGAGRQTTGGKAPATARKTTGGKTVSRKATGGKTTRGGKAPKGSARRKSTAE